jgi:hypothetical protein
MAIEFRQNMRLQEIVKFTTETKQRIDHPILQKSTNREKTLFLSRLYGSSCDDVKLTIRLPRTYRIIRSIPYIAGKKGVYTHYLNIQKLEPIQIAIMTRKCMLPLLARIVDRDTHPIVWAIIGALIGWGLSKLF